MERKEQGRKMKKKLLANWGLKLISILIAFGLWFTVMYIDDPIDSETFTNIPVQFVNTTKVTGDGKVYEVLEDSDVVKRVTVSAPRKVLAEMREKGKSSIIATADFEEMNLSGVIDITVAVASQYTSLINEIDAQDAQLKLLVEDEVEKSVSVKVLIKGEEALAEGHQLGSSAPDENRITVTGGKSKVDQVSYAAVTVDVTGVDSNISTTETIKLYDANGEELANNLVQKSINTTKVDVTVLGTKTVPIEYSVSGEVMDGYRMSGENTLSKEEVKLAGIDSALNSVETIVIPPEILDVTDLSEDLVKEVNLRSYLPDGVQIAKDETETKVTISIGIEEILERNYKLQSGKVQITNVPEGYLIETAENHEVYDVKVAGLIGELNQITEGELNAVVDISAWMDAEDIEQLHEGTYYIPAQIELPEGVEMLEPTEIRITFVTQAAE